MAEIINKPKKFTKDWYLYVWDYYKIHILVSLAVLVLAVITVVEYNNMVKYDLNVNYVSKNTIMSESITEEFSKHIRDINNDDETHVSLTNINFTDESATDMNETTALYNKLMAMFASDEEMLYIFDEAMFKEVLSMSMTEGMFVSVSEWAQNEVSEDSLFEFGGGVYGVNLKNSSLLTEASDLYVAVRMNYDTEDEKLSRIYENALLLANALIK